jgi:hypothetical protein
VTDEICGNVYPGVQPPDHQHVCGLILGHEDTGEPLCDYHDCIARDIGWTYTPDMQQPGSGESG